VWIPKYRKHIFSKEVSGYVKMILGKIAGEYEFRIETMEMMGDHIHVFIEILPRYSPGRMAQIMKNISAREVFKPFPPDLRRQLWRGALA